jgi:hypothetical protein
MPVLAANILVVSIAATVNSNAEDDKDLFSYLARPDTKATVIL